MKHLLVKRILFMMILFVIVIPFYQVNADMVAGPRKRENAFYEKVQYQCEYVYKSYVANGQKGYIKIWLSPKQQRKVTSLLNNTVFKIRCIYQDEKLEKWGYVHEYHGWISMRDVYKYYDASAFKDEHYAKIKEYNEGYNPKLANTTIYLYRYPGSNEIVDTITENFSQEYIVYTYQDINNRLWGCYDLYRDVPAYRKKVDESWFCITDPSNKNLPEIAYQSPIIIPAATNQSIATGVFGVGTSILVIAGLLVLLVVIMMVVIHVIWRGENRNE